MESVAGASKCWAGEVKCEPSCVSSARNVTERFAIREHSYARYYRAEDARGHGNTDLWVGPGECGVDIDKGLEGAEEALAVRLLLESEDSLQE